MNFGTVKDIFVEKLVESYTNGDDKGRLLYTSPSPRDS